MSIALNALLARSNGVEEPVVTPESLLETLADPHLAAKNAEDGEGVRFDELHRTVLGAVEAYGLEGAEVDVFEPADSSPATLARLQAILAADHGDQDQVLLAYYNQGVLIGDWDGPHVSPIGGYVASTGRVLLLDVDPLHQPFWASDHRLLRAMRRPAPLEHGPLAGETGGLIRLKAA